MERVTRENLSHLLATMHLVMRQQDGRETGVGHYNHLTNATYEKFVERWAEQIKSGQGCCLLDSVLRNKTTWVQAKMQCVSLARFQSLACEKHQEVQDTHANMVAIMQRVQQEYKNGH